MSKNIYKGPTLLRVGERSARDRKYAKDEYVLAQPGTVVAPRPKGEKPTLENAARAIFKQVRETLPGAQLGAAVSGLPSLVNMLRSRGTKQPAGLPKVADTVAPTILGRVPPSGGWGGPGGVLPSPSPTGPSPVEEVRQPGEGGWGGPGGVLPAFNDVRSRLTSPKIPQGGDPEGQRQAIVDRFTAIIQMLEQVNPALAQRLAAVRDRVVAAFIPGMVQGANPSGGLTLRMPTQAPSESTAGTPHTTM